MLTFHALLPAIVLLTLPLATPTPVDTGTSTTNDVIGHCPPADLFCPINVPPNPSHPPPTCHTTATNLQVDTVKCECLQQSNTVCECRGLKDKGMGCVVMVCDDTSNFVSAPFWLSLSAGWGEG